MSFLSLGSALGHLPCLAFGRLRVGQDHFQAGLEEGEMRIERWK